MKLRIHKNSIRLRLSQPEIRQFGTDGKVSESVAFGPGDEDHLLYQLEQSESENLEAFYLDHMIKVKVPLTVASHWVNTPEQVGISAELQLGNGNSLSVLIEKDFKCLIDRPGEDEGDLFPNPARNKQE